MESVCVTRQTHRSKYLGEGSRERIMPDSAPLPFLVFRSSDEDLDLAGGGEL